MFIHDEILLTEERIKKKNLYHIRLEDFFGDMNVLKAFQLAERNSASHSGWWSWDLNNG